tara:strand:- start:469 stop:663 length:195 start_codon:yes stop_codon:yes gene_type:complete
MDNSQKCHMLITSPPYSQLAGFAPISMDEDDVTYTYSHTPLTFLFQLTGSRPLPSSAEQRQSRA